jgi:hypothetical protein
MARLLARGSTVASPAADRNTFKNILAGLCPGYAFDDRTTDGFYDQIAQVIGRWSSEQGRLEATPVAKALKILGKSLADGCRTLEGHESGLRTTLEVEIVSVLSEYLANDSTVGSIENAHTLISSFRESASRIAAASTAAALDLEQQKGRAGRDRLDWYDDFTALLLQIAELAGIQPRFGKDWIEDAHIGWLFDAAQALELTLLKDMRSASTEACGKRLERSRKRLKRGRGQNPPGRQP